MNILEKITQDKQLQVNQELTHISASDLRKTAQDTRVPLDFKAALRTENLSIIAEVKKASPSKGIIREDFDPVSIAQSYEKNGANCISVLTESKYFQGDNSFLKSIREAVAIPLLRKDFIIDERQIRESYELGADAILLIVASLSKEQLLHFHNLAQSFGLTCLVEVHTMEELNTALSCEFTLIGINNRNLITFETDIQHSIDLRRHIPDHVVCVSESGIHSEADCQRLFENCFDAILVGESLMRQPDPGKAIHTLRLKD